MCYRRFADPIVGRQEASIVYKIAYEDHRSVARKGDYSQIWLKLYMRCIILHLLTTQE